MKVVAILSVYNEEVYISRCLQHLIDQGIKVCVIDNESTDRTFEIVSSFLNRGVIHIETIHREGIFNWDSILRRKEELSYELGADWYIHHDADEIRMAPHPYATLLEGVKAADRKGYNAINFDEFVFVPTSEYENYEHDRFIEEMKYYYFFEPAPQRRVNAWKSFGQKIDLHTSGGHHVQFEKQCIYPRNFILRHYIVLSQAHAIRKYCSRVYSEEESRVKRWHDVRSYVHPDQISFPDQNRLKKISPKNEWDCSDPWTVHAIFENVPLMLKPTKIRENTTEELPAPFVVGLARSGTTLLRLMLDNHPDLAIPSETHFIPSLSQVITKGNLDFSFFLKTIMESSWWNDFHIDSNVFQSRVKGLKNFNVTNGLRVFYKLYAERFEKKRWGDKTPPYISFMELIYELLPEARFIHVIRDGRDVALSVMNLWFGPNSIQEAASQWIWKIKEARRQAQNISYYLEIRYEDLILNTENTLRCVCDFLNLSWNSKMLEYHEGAKERLNEFKRDIVLPEFDRFVRADDRIEIHALTGLPPQTSRIERWKKEMKSSDKKIYESIAAPMLRELGYEV